MNNKDNRIATVALVSQILPATNYSRYLANALGNCLVYTDKDPKNLETELKNRVRLTWTKNSLKYPFEILKQARKDGVKLIHLQHEFNMFGTSPTNAAMFIIMLPLLRLFGIKVVTTVHAVVTPSQVDLRFLETFGWKAKPLLILPVKIFLKVLYITASIFSNRIIVHSEVLKDMLARDYNISTKKIAVIPHGVPELKAQTAKEITPPIPQPPRLNLQKPRRLFLGGVEELAVCSPRKYLLYFGYFHRRKGLEDLVNAFALVSRKEPKLKLVLAGGCLQKDFEDRVKHLVVKLGLKEKVIFTGFLDESDLNWLLSNCLMVVLPLTYSVSASGPLAQAIAHHKPIVTTDLGVSSKEIVDGRTGLLVPPKDPDRLATAILKLCDDSSLRKSIAANLEKMQAERAWPKITAATKKIYEKVLC